MLIGLNADETVRVVLKRAILQHSHMHTPHACYSTRVEIVSQATLEHAHTPTHATVPGWKS
jgi:hypothetical protein